jgi:hypothetical protein
LVIAKTAAFAAFKKPYAKLKFCVSREARKSFAKLKFCKLWGSKEEGTEVLHILKS